MSNSELTKVFSLIPSLFFLFVASYYLVTILIFFKDKSLGIITNGKETILKTWLFFLFCFAYGYTIFMIYSFEQITIFGITIESFYSKGFGFVLGLISMILVYILSIKINKKKIVDVEKNDVTFLTNDITTENINVTSIRMTGRQTTRVLHKNSNLILHTSDEEVKKKMALIKNSYDLSCDYNDFKNMLKGNELIRKIVFLDKFGEPFKFSKPEYLKFLNLIVDGNIAEHKNNSKIIAWIESTFANDNISGQKISTQDISKLRKKIKEG
ncbi:hypothetical protein [Flavobacterium sp.]|uniref:hypothetical protein n=1 Tax=Flavobacterium sp. TaxID=239 RepID=UPI002CEB31F7|nr:hypothetical protein [Flavobacterium sp.]HSD07674.1 hypothetical protein [Flavobacterium sp.]